jgi:hypothetical protein
MTDPVKDVKVDEVEKPPVVTDGPDLSKPPEGISEDEWSDLSDAEKGGFLDKSDGSEPEIDEETLAEVSGDKIKTPEEIATETKTDADAATVVKPVVDEKVVDPPVVPDEKAPEGIITDEELSRFRATVGDNELPAIDTVPEEMQDQIDELDEKLAAEEITQAEYNKSLGEINRKIMGQNIKAQESAKGQLLWDKEQQYFLKARPMYREKTPKGNALFGALGEVVKDLGKDPKYSGVSGIELLIAADKSVREIFGIVDAKPIVKEPVKAEPEKKEPKPAAPLPTIKTLGQVPASAVNDTSGLWGALDKLTGPAYEEALEKLTQPQRDAYLAAR